MKKKIYEFIFLHYNSLFIILFFILSIIFFLGSLPDGNTKTKNFLWLIGLISSFIILILKNRISENIKLFPFFYYIFICFCSLPLNTSTVLHINYLYFKPFIISTIIILLIFLKNDTYRTRKIFNLFVLILIMSIMYEILAIGKSFYLAGIHFNSLVGNINRVYLEISFLCYGSALNISSKKNIYYNRLIIPKLFNLFIFCIINTSTVLFIFYQKTQSQILIRELSCILFPYCFLEIFVLYKFIALLTKNRFPGDIISKKIFYDDIDIHLSEVHITRYKYVVREINKIKSQIKQNSEMDKDELEKKLKKLLVEERILKRHTIILQDEDNKKI